MALPFTVEQFFGLFATYNQLFWIAAVVLWLASAALLAAAWRQPERWSRALSALLAVHWLWSGVAYHGLLFTRINPAAWIFAALFVMESGLLAWRGRTVSVFARPGMRNAVGLGLACYALAYPVLSLLMHDYPAAPTFGVPCPTTILTIGVLMTASNAVSWLAVGPVLWGLVGGSAAVLLAVPSDYVLLGAGILLPLALIADGRRGAH
jgi:hypothetical protein